MDPMADPTGPEEAPPVARVCLAAIAAFMLPVGVQATFAPRSFFDDFPLGRGWVAVDGAYNEHLVRDVGLLFLALILVTAWTAWRAPGMTVIVSIAWLVQGLGHLAYHVGHLDGLDGVDKVGFVGSLVAVPVLASVALWTVLGPAPATRAGGDR
jgi:hypothetical protein